MFTVLPTELSSIIDRWATLLGAGSIVLISFQDLYQTQPLNRATPAAYATLIPTPVRMPVYWHLSAETLRRRIRRWVIRGGYFFVGVMFLLTVHFFLGISGITANDWYAFWAGLLGISIDERGLTAGTFSPSTALPTFTYYLAWSLYWCSTKEVIRNAADVVAIGVIVGSTLLIPAMLEVRRFHLEVNQRP